METISIENAINLKDVTIIDTRSQKEFLIDTIPGSINLPILDDSERKAVGILYKTDQKKAFDLGFDYFDKKLGKIKKFLGTLDKKKLTDEIASVPPEVRRLISALIKKLRKSTNEVLKKFDMCG